MEQNNAPTLKHRLHCLAAFLPIFEQPDFTFGSWSGSNEGEPNVITMPYFMFSRDANAFVQSAYDLGWVQRGFNWPEWTHTPEARDLRDDPKKMTRATPDQLSRLLTVIIRQERFCEGSIESAFESGLLTAICRRAAHLESETDDEET
jgi:hypothetical protein